METTVGPIPEDNRLVFELLMVLGVAQLVHVDRQTFGVGTLDVDCAR